MSAGGLDDGSMLDPLEGFEVQAGEFGGNGMPILHEPCGEKLCDVEGGDTLALLVRTALAHVSACKAQTWTFVGHWSDADEIVVEYIMDGLQQDLRQDVGFWAGGLFAEAASGLTQEAALERLREKYEDNKD